MITILTSTKESNSDALMDVIFSRKKYFQIQKNSNIIVSYFLHLLKILLLEKNKSLVLNSFELFLAHVVSLSLGNYSFHKKEYYS